MRCRSVSLLFSVVLSVVLIGCASHPRKVDCEGKLRPINAPAPAVHSDATRHEG